MLTKLLAPLDGSEAAESGLAWAEEAAARAGASLRLVTVVQNGALEGSSTVKSAETYLAAHRERIASSGLNADYDVEEGSAADLILARAREADLIVMTCGGGPWLLGGTLDRVLREVPNPKAIVHARRSRMPIGGDDYKILLPLDIGFSTESIVPAATQFAKSLKGSIVLCHIVPAIGFYKDPAEAPPGVARALEQQVTQGREFLGEVAGRLASQGVSVEVLVRVGEAPTEIVRVGADSGANLMMMCTRGADKLSRLLGSVAYAALQQGTLPCVLIRDSGAIGCSNRGSPEAG